jgi:Cu-processing system permease protein
VTSGLFTLQGREERVLVSLLNPVLFLLPLTSILFGTLYLYQNREFIELMLSQPVSRLSLFGGLYLGVALPLILGFGGGILIPFFIYSLGTVYTNLFLLLLVGSLLILVFLGLALAISLRFEDRLKGFSTVIFLWLYATILYDGFILLMIFVFREYPLEKLLLILILGNPIDLGRILLLLQLNFSAMMGYTGAIFQQYFQGFIGIVITGATLLLWMILPALFGWKIFLNKDF